MKFRNLWLNSALVLILFGACSSPKQKEEFTKPNILFIAVDDLRPQLGVYGQAQIKSPNIDKLAGQGLVFNRAYCNVPVCGASRASLLTGARPTRHRFINARTSKDVDYPEAVSLPMLFKNNGYTTISNGKIYHHHNDDSLAWDENWRSDGKWDYALEESQKIRKNTYRGLPFESANVHDSVYRDGKLALKVISDLNKLKNTNKPFFLTMGLAKPHLPFTAPEKYWNMYDREKIFLPEKLTNDCCVVSRIINKYKNMHGKVR